MVKHKTKKTKIEVTVNRIKEVFELHIEGTDKKDYSTRVVISPDHIEISDEFVFKSRNNKETIKRWENVINMLSAAVVLLKEKQK